MLHRELRTVISTRVPSESRASLCFTCRWLTRLATPARPQMPQKHHKYCFWSYK